MHLLDSESEEAEYPLVYAVHEEASARRCLALEASPFLVKSWGVAFYSAGDWEMLATNCALPCIETTAGEYARELSRIGFEVIHVTYPPMRANALRTFLACLLHAEENKRKGDVIVSFNRWISALSPRDLAGNIEKVRECARGAGGFDAINLLRWQDRADWNREVARCGGLRLLATQYAHGDQMFIVSPEGRIKLLANSLVKRYDLLGKPSLDDCIDDAPENKTRAVETKSAREPTERLASLARALGGVEASRRVRETARLAQRSVKKASRARTSHWISSGDASCAPSRDILCLCECHHSRLDDGSYTKKIPYHITNSQDRADDDPTNIARVEWYLRSSSLDAFLHHATRNDKELRTFVVSPSLLAFDLQTVFDFGDYYKTHECLRPPQIVESNAERARREIAQFSGKSSAAWIPAATFAAVILLIALLVVFFFVFLLRRREAKRARAPEFGTDTPRAAPTKRAL